MFRRFATPLAGLFASAVSRRCYTPSTELKELYESNFEKASFPCISTPSDSVLFAKFLYKAMEPSENFDAVLEDFKAIAAAVPQLPIFWERTCKISEVQEFSGLSEPTLFTLEWMQSNGMLDQLVDVAEAYETYVNAKLSRVAVRIYVGADMQPEVLERAKTVAGEMIAQNPELSSLTPVYKVSVDRAIVKGFTLDVHGMYRNEAEGRKVQAAAAGEADFTSIPVPHLPKTTWADNVETEALRTFLADLAQYDLEELKHGV